LLQRSFGRFHADGHYFARFFGRNERLPDVTSLEVLLGHLGEYHLVQCMLGDRAPQPGVSLLSSFHRVSYVWLPTETGDKAIWRKEKCEEYSFWELVRRNPAPLG
jgi:hypothetical protein